MTLPRLLIVDDNEDYLRSLERGLRDLFEVTLAPDESMARSLLAKGADVVLLDICLREGDGDRQGVELLREFLEHRPDLAIVMISAHGDLDVAVKCMQAGAMDFIEKPASLMELRQRLLAALEKADLTRRSGGMEERIERQFPADLVGISPAINQARRVIDMVAADGKVTVLVRGETGTGKDVVANAIHRTGVRSRQPFVALNLAALSPSLLESELFGHEKGAFTGATQRKIGYIEKARRGVLFLDEIGEIPADLQVKLLRFLETKTFERVGSTTPQSVDIQLVAATNRDLERGVREGTIRSDFYYRLKTIEIYIPPLRERREDIPTLVDHFLGRIRTKGDRSIKGTEPSVMDYLQSQDWRGNARELLSALDRAALSARSRNSAFLEMKDFQVSETLSSISGTPALGKNDLPPEGVSLEEELARHELGLIEAALRQTGGKKGEAWRLLGLNDRFALRRRLRILTSKYPEMIADYPIAFGDQSQSGKL